MKGRSMGPEQQLLECHHAAVVDAREQGATCREIAERYNVPEYTVHYFMRRTGNAGRWHGRHKRRDSSRVVSFDKAMSLIDEAADELTIERTADESGWIATVDDLSGDAAPTMRQAIISAFRRWRA